MRLSSGCGRRNSRILGIVDVVGVRLVVRCSALRCTSAAQAEIFKKSERTRRRASSAIADSDGAAAAAGTTCSSLACGELIAENDGGSFDVQRAIGTRRRSPSRAARKSAMKSGGFCRRRVANARFDRRRYRS